MAMPTKTNVLEGSVQRHILRMLAPFTLAVIALISTGIVDTIYLGRLTDPARPNLAIMALAAIGIAFPINFFGNSANIGLGAGAMSAVSRALGQGDEGKAKRHAAAALLLGVTAMLCVVTILLLVAPFLLNFTGASDEVVRMAFGYLVIVMPGLVFMSIASMGNNALRAHGEAALPSSIMILSAFINLVLDPFLIFGLGPFPRLELQGAAIATLCGNVIAACYGFYIVFFHRKIIDFVGMSFASMKRAWIIIGSVGIPAFGTNIIVPISTFAAVAIVGNILGEVDVAAFTVASRAELISVGLLYARVRTAFRVCYQICFIWGTGMALLFAIFAQQIAGLFTSDMILIEKIVPYFYIVPVTIFGWTTCLWIDLYDYPICDSICRIDCCWCSYRRINGRIYRCCDRKYHFRPDCIRLDNEECTYDRERELTRTLMKGVS